MGNDERPVLTDRARIDAVLRRAVSRKVVDVVILGEWCCHTDTYAAVPSNARTMAFYTWNDILDAFAFRPGGPVLDRSRAKKWSWDRAVHLEGCLSVGVSSRDEGGVRSLGPRIQRMFERAGFEAVWNADTWGDGPGGAVDVYKRAVPAQERAPNILGGETT